jgi:hypothetical protein
MGVDSKLVINSRYGVGEIRKLIEGFGFKTKADYQEDHAFVTVSYPGLDFTTWLYMARSTEYGGLDSTVLSCRMNNLNIALLRRIADVVGGFLNENDTTSDWVDFQDPHNGYARFILDHVILAKGLTSGSELAKKLVKALDYE